MSTIAQLTQFTEIGWRFLAPPHGAGALLGGKFVTLADEKTSNFSIVMESLNCSRGLIGKG